MSDDKTIEVSFTIATAWKWRPVAIVDKSINYFVFNFNWLCFGFAYIAPISKANK